MKPASEPQVKTPAAPPVEMMYCFPAASMSGTLAAATLAPAMVAQFSLPHSPVAKAQVITDMSAGMAWLTGMNEPVTCVDMTKLFQFMVLLASL